MFDIGILELFLVLVIGLVVLGPERLPEVVKSVTRSMKWIKKTITSTKEEVSKNIGLDEVYQDLRNEEILKKSETDGHQNKEE
ncbi:Sec-independent protein translocase protein TatB [Gammaproteobacteria bacterium]|jgi:sec-independent protein translocase protein TatB|nr:Sec-independent protein translocase protein TatB [Gammaproteobacteria bacterium]MDC0028624.1 Sec-independent protein translocase protein TatB [Gammaproteobacteria bacterium]|tara:strand:- start:590 stop:838 length:249 start_codon:yes stop_codon:yes gene_type:complete